MVGCVVDVGYCVGGEGFVKCEVMKYLLDWRYVLFDGVLVWCS